MIRSPGHQAPNEKTGRHTSKFRLIARRLHHDFRYNLTSRQRSALVAYLSFVVSIGAVRSLTTAIRTQRLPLHDITAGDVHIHHYLPGIALLTVAGGIGVRGSDKANVHCLLGATYGTGCALITDELPLLLDLRDVYWTPEGRWALDAALGIIASAGAYFSGIPLWHGLREEITGKWPKPGPARSPVAQAGAGQQQPP
jgi:hypothetical protein